MLKMLPSQEVEIYISQVGYLCFKTEDQYEGPQLVKLSREQSLILKDHLTDLLAFQDEIWDGLHHSDTDGEQE